MKRKYLYKPLICLVLSLIMLVSGFVPAMAAQPILKHICIGYWDIWRHSDGVTWQYTGSPGQQKDHIFELERPESMAEYQNVGYKIITTEITEESYNQLGAYQGMSYDDFDLNIYRYKPDNYQQKGDKTVSFKLDGDFANIKKDWQNKLVEGRRWFLPVVIEWYGDPAAPPPKPKEPEFLPCTEAPSIANSWETVYSWEVYHSSSYTDPITGESIDDSWTETIYETVPYSENLQAVVSVNTKQGIRESTWESRGSWEIIPWAKKNGLDPNEVTRSGYGFEVKVQTTYSTDWENKVPVSASPYGGTYKGPDRVAADFYDTKGRYVTRMDLIPTRGKPGDNSITWELPLQRYEYADGSRVDHRKHYTDVSMPDGKYMVKATISGAGKTDLCLIQKKYVTIYGDMWEDSYTRVSAHDE